MYIDLQVNGYVGIDFSSEKLKGDDIKYVTEQLYNAGTSGYCPTLITSSSDIIENNIKTILKQIHTGLNKEILGIHLEGPFISQKEGARGCHPKKYIKSASIDNMKKWIDISEGEIKIVTLAPDVEGAMELIQFLVEQNITVSLGHHTAQNDLIEKAVNLGAKACTHLGNGIPKQLDRTDNPIIDQLVNNQLYAMFITDGHHLSDQFIKLAYMTKGLDKFIVTSDSAPIAGLSPGNYNWAGNNLTLKKNGTIFSITSNTLAGSSATMKECIDKVRKVLNLSDNEVKKIGITNPKKLLGIK